MTQEAPLAEPLSSAFERQVLRHPDIEALLREVRAKPALFDQCKREFSPPSWPSWRLQNLLEGSYALQSGLWPAYADKGLRDQAEDRASIGFLTPITPDARRVLLVVADRFEEFIVPLRNGTVSAQGHLVNGDLVRLSVGIWCGHDSWIDIFAGCVGDFAGSGDDAPEFVPRWKGVALAGRRQAAALGSASRSPREKTSQIKISLAVAALWPSPGDLDGLSAKERDRKINLWLQDQGKGSVSGSSIKRYFTNRDRVGPLQMPGPFRAK